MLPPRQKRQNSAKLDGRADGDGEHVGPVAPAARKGMTSTPRQRPSRGKRSEHARGAEAGRKRPASDRQATVRPGSQLPESRIAEPPETPLDFEERQYVWATKDNESLKRNIGWQWHQTAQRLVTYMGPSSLALVVFFLTREWGLAPQTAVKLSLACLASATAGVFSRGLLTLLNGKRRSLRNRSEDDVSRNGDARSS